MIPGTESKNDYLYTKYHDDNSFIKYYQLVYIYYESALWVRLFEDLGYLIACSQETLKTTTFILNSGD